MISPDVGSINRRTERRRRKFTVGFDCVRTTNDAAEYPHFVYKYSPTIQHMSNQSDSSIEPGKLLVTVHT